jgi:cell division protein ZapE
MSTGQDVTSVYEQNLQKRGFVKDSSQWRAVERLQRLYEEWGEYKSRRSNALKRLVVRPALPKGVYLWGAVGRGKSFLMDAFYLCVPLVRKRRVHFHHFMREIHRELAGLQSIPDPLAEVALRTARRYRLICFDEFHVSDIADAMILGRYMEKVMDAGVQFVMTSNYHPDDLYPNGLQRERFLPAIELLKTRLDVVEVDGGQDYRRLKMEKLRAYHLGPWRRGRAGRHLRGAEGRGRGEASARRRGTPDPLPQARGRVGMVRFRRAVRRPALLCRLSWTWRGAFHTVLLSGVPKMSPMNADRHGASPGWWMCSTTIA